MAQENKDDLVESLLLKEMKEKDLIDKVRSAEAYLYAGGVNSKNKSIALYHEVLNNLSQEALSELDQGFLSQARSDDANGYIDDALAKYRDIFREVFQELKKTKLKG